MQAKILLFYDSCHLLRSVYCKATHPNFPVTGTVRNTILFSQLVVPSHQPTKTSGGAFIFCDFIASAQQKMVLARGGSPTADGVPPPHGKTARTQRAESTDEHAWRITRLYFRKHPDFLPKHADFLQLLLECSFPSRA